MRYSEIIFEAQIQNVEVFGKPIRVWINPTHFEFYRLLANVSNVLRGSLDHELNLYVWDASLGIHALVEEELGFIARLRIMLRSDQITLEGTTMSETELREIPSINRVYGDNEFDVFDDSAEPEWEGDEDDI